MPCYTPLTAYRAEGGRIVFNSREGWSDRPLQLQCGQCQGCRLERSRQWALRCVHEAQLHPHNCFITLTYRPKDLPVDGSLDVRHWQLFAKRLRKKLGPFRFLHCGEYGDTNFRPHYHACIFGLDFSHDRQLFKKQGPNETFVSADLEETWGLGFATVGHLTWQSAAYVARYVMKKATGDLAKERYRRLDLETGEETYVKPEYITMSRRPGLAAEWFRTYKPDVFPSDEVVHDGKRHRPPKFYDNLHEREDPQAHETIKAKRRERVAARAKDYTPERLKTREKVAEARLSQLRRPI